MKKLVFVLMMTIGSIAQASEFCAGFTVGFQTVRGNNAIVPICPIQPITPIGSTPYQEGLKKGMAAASGY